MMSICACDTDTQTEETTSQNTVYTVAVPVETTMETEPVETTIVEIPVYSLEGMTADEIIEIIQNLTDVHTGDLIEEYPNRFAVAPSNSDIYEYRFYTSDNRDEVTNCIYSVNNQVQQEMDGTYTVTYGSHITIEIRLNDYSVAEDLYDKVYDMLCDSPSDEPVVLEEGYSWDNREGTNWDSRIAYEVLTPSDEYYGSMSSCYDINENMAPDGYHYNYPQFDISMWKSNDTYILTLNIPVFPNRT